MKDNFPLKMERHEGVPGHKDTLSTFHAVSACDAEATSPPEKAASPLPVHTAFYTPPAALRAGLLEAGLAPALLGDDS